MTDLARHQLRAAVRQNKDTGTDLLERLFARLFQGLVYPQIWEDPVVDMQALEIGPDDHIICIASGGCNMMSYLTAGPARLTAVDLSPAHVALGRLKLAAARHLPDHGAFYQFFGRADLALNTELYRRYLRAHLDPVTRDYWEARAPLRRRIDMFSRGVYRHGLLGRFLGAAHLLARLGGTDFAPMLAARGMAEQQAVFDEQIAPLFDMALVRWLTRSRASLFGLGIPPEQYEKLAADGDGDVLPVLRDRLRKLLCDFPLQDNYFAWQALTRQYDPAPNGSLPPYLQHAAFDTLRDSAPRARVLNQSLTDMLVAETSGSAQGYVLLDAQDWMNDAQLNALWTQITRTASPGARVIFRTGGRTDILPGRVDPALLGRWRYDHEVSARATRDDRSAIYGAFHLYHYEG